MPQMKFETTARRKRILEALAEDRDCTVDQLLEPYIRDLVENAAGIRPDLPEAVQDAIADDVASKASARKAAREAEKKAQADAAKKVTEAPTALAT